MELLSSANLFNIILFFAWANRDLFLFIFVFSVIGNILIWTYTVNCIEKT